MRFTVALVFMMAVNVMLFLFQNSMDLTAGSDGHPIIYNNANTPYSYFVTNGTDANHVVGLNSQTDLPDATSGSVGQSNGFGDLFNTLKSWINGAVGVGKVVWSVVTAMPTFLQAMADQHYIPQIIAGILGALWTVISLILVVSWLRWNF